MQHLETEYKTHDGITLYLQAWMPKESKAAVLLVHGLAEHSGRYADFANHLVSNDISVFSFDGRGHGKSIEKPTAYFASYIDYLRDIHELFNKVKSYNPDKPVFILGHSMGGALVASYLLKYKPVVSGVILSAPAFKLAEGTSKILLAVSGVLTQIAPKMHSVKLDVSKISHDAAVVSAYEQDPLIAHNGVPVRTGHEIMKMIDLIGEKSGEFEYPVLLMHGTSDALTNPKGSEEFFEKIGSADKTLKHYPDYYHELLNEVEKEKVYKDISDWMAKRV